ncbi:Decaprenyl diphosphate synthase [Fagus crenata]
MVLHMVALAKLKLLSHSHNLISPMVTSLVWPFLLKLSFSFRFIRRAYTDLVHASRTFFFQLRQIALNPEPALGNTTRLERALQLVYQRVTRTRRSQAQPLDDDNFHTLSMFAL